MIDFKFILIMKKIIKISSPTCMECLALDKMLKKDMVDFSNIDCIEDPSAVKKYEVFAVPTLILLNNDEEILRMTKINYTEYKNIIEEFKKN